MDEDEKLAYYLEVGAIELQGIDESGEFIFSINESAKELAPELWEAHSDYVNDTLLKLYEKGLVNVSYDENLEAIIEITPEGMEIIKASGLVNIDEDFEE